MVKEIHEYQGKSLSDLEVRPGELIAFDNKDLEFPSPLLLASYQDMSKVDKDEVLAGQMLIFYPQMKDQESWVFYPKNDVILGLWPDKKVEIITKPYSYGSYLVEDVYVGEELIKSMLEKNKQGFDVWADQIEDLKRRLERDTFKQISKDMKTCAISLIDLISGK